jgi:ribosomal protein L40E
MRVAPLGSGAAIRNVGFDRTVKVNERFSIKVTVRNIDLGDIGATLVLVVKSGGHEVARETAYVLKYLWSVHTLSLSFVATSPGTRHIELELYWDNQGSLQLQDSTEFDVTAVEGSTAVVTTQGAVTVMRKVTVQGTIDIAITITRTETRAATSTRTVHTTVLKTVTANPLTVSQTRTGVTTSTVYSPTVYTTLEGAQAVSHPFPWFLLSTFVMITAVVHTASGTRLRKLSRRVEALFPFRLTALTVTRLRESIFAMSLVSLIVISASGQVGQPASASPATTTLTATVTEWATLAHSVTSTRYVTSIATATSTFTRTDFTTITPTSTRTVDHRSTTTVYIPTTITNTAKKSDTQTAALISWLAVQTNWIQIASVMVLIVVVFAVWRSSKRRPKEKPGTDWVFCVECGAENPRSNEYCGMCGRKLMRTSV